MKNLLLTVFFLLLFYLTPSISLAANSLDVVINEVAWMGTKIEGIESKNWWRYEWIEIYNARGQETDISGWKIENAGAKNETVVISSGKIAPNGYFLICKTEIGNCDLINSKLSLHNEYDKNGRLALKDAGGNLVDVTPEANPSTGSGQVWPGGNNNNETKQTMERKNPLVAGSDLNNWQTSKDAGGTPKTQNSAGTTDMGQTPAATQQNPPMPIIVPIEVAPTGNSVEALEKVEPPPTYPTGVILNEILPSPEGADDQNEWIVTTITQNPSVCS